MKEYHFKKGYDVKRNYNGAPKKIFSQANDYGYTSQEIRNTIMNIISLTIDEIKSIAENQSSSVLERIISKSLLRDFSKGSLWNLETIITRSIGKPKESIDMSSEKIEVIFVQGKTIL